jgi:hypothetical protein
MRGAHRAIAASLCAASLVAIGACGEEETTHVVEGEPIELGQLEVNVQLTRFLNPVDPEDSEYLEGQRSPPESEDYLAVFMRIENTGDQTVRLPAAGDLEVVDTTGAKFEALPTNSVFALPLGEDLGSDKEVPGADTAAGAGPIQGSFVLFLLDTAAAENRPLELEITADGEKGTVELDI